MGQEVIDIVVKESGADVAGRDILNIGTAADTADPKVEKLNAAITALAGSVDKNTTAVTAASQAAQKQATDEEKAAAATRQHAAAMESGAAAAEQLRGVLVSLGLALGLNEWTKLTDAYQANVNQLRQVTISSENFAAVQERLHQLSEETFSDVGTNTRLFTSLTKATRDLHFSQSDLLNIIHTLNDALRLGGSTSDEAQQALQALSTAFQKGAFSARQILPLLHQMPDLVAALADKFGFGGQRTAEFVDALSKGRISTQAFGDALAHLDNSLIAGARHQDEHTKKLDESLRSVTILRSGTDSLAGSFGGSTRKIIEVTQSVTDMNHTVDAAGHSMQVATVAGNALAQKFQQVTPTIRDAWKNVQNALESYIGTQDRMTAGNARVAQALQFVATNSHAVFGVLQVLAAALGTYTLAVNASRIATLLFASTFSPIALAVTIIATAAAAMVAFGNDVKLSTDGSITALGAFYAVLTIVKDGVVALWNFVGQAGPWAQAALAVGGLMVAMQLLLGLNVIGWITAAVGALGSLAIATYAAIGPWGLLATAIIGAALALAYYTGNLDKAIEAVKDTMAPALDFVTQKMKDMSASLNQTAIATKDFGRTTEDVAVQVQNGYGSMGNAAQQMAAQTSTALKSSETGFQDWAGEVSTSLSSVASKAQSTASVLSSLSKNTRGQMSSDFISGFTGDFFADNPTSGHHAGVVINNSGTLSSNDLHNPRFADGGSFMVGGQGGTDSQLVKFMASPDERVTIETPGQQRSRGGGNPAPIVHVSMAVTTKDATSFDQNRQQIVMGLQSELTRAVRRIGG